ncbi:hypothetical protein TraAM80_02641 [Trypanosoma rangeli]|uniref:Uncharacterized protein n=1 Tax=Trypanosoma rangeli TaxID=5698 RepID=A0A422NT04_TRYRA|nr:uncharacterized protein TraAM80_02641 [Trypanosoma rangeli]RNF08615.1 hypothetical protein TraAM80_02641 [Trypanosoma rangeli]|eukprot:RNF08615.1 hypothetical protein TraAM80_02641 [Trypanosoma rangeli]
MSVSASPSETAALSHPADRDQEEENSEDTPPQRQCFHCRPQRYITPVFASHHDAYTTTVHGRQVNIRMCKFLYKKRRSLFLPAKTLNGIYQMPQLQLGPAIRRDCEEGVEGSKQQGVEQSRSQCSTVNLERLTTQSQVRHVLV